MPNFELKGGAAVSLGRLSILPVDSQFNIQNSTFKIHHCLSVGRSALERGWHPAAIPGIVRSDRTPRIFREPPC
jgi:hypothetical protein